MKWTKVINSCNASIWNVTFTVLKWSFIGDEYLCSGLLSIQGSRRKTLSHNGIQGWIETSCLMQPEQSLTLIIITLHGSDSIDNPVLYSSTKIFPVNQYCIIHLLQVKWGIKHRACSPVNRISLFCNEEYDRSLLTSSISSFLYAARNL